MSYASMLARVEIFDELGQERLERISQICRRCLHRFRCDAAPAPGAGVPNGTTPGLHGTVARPASRPSP